MLDHIFYSFFTSLMSDFISTMTNSYQFAGSCIRIGNAMQDTKATNIPITLPLSTLNRHGLIAGATGTGKTKSLQLIIEQLSEAGVPSLVMDVKGDLSWVSQLGQINDKILQRSQMLGIERKAQSYPVEFLTISDKPWLPCRSTITEFGPVLLAKILELNDTQSSILSLVFKFCDDQGMLLLDLPDLKKVLQYMIDQGKEDIKSDYGSISPASVSTILRKIIEIEQQGATSFFGEPSLDVQDLLQTRDDKGVINVLRINDIPDKPKFFSTFMLALLAELYMTLPEEWDLVKPKFCLFIDEAHLVFDNASKSLLDQLETTIKLIRSKGVGIYFITQLPTDIPASILSQLWLKIQHALRAFTAKDRQTIKLASQNFPDTDYYQVDELLTQLGIWEALVTGLNEQWIPTALVHTMMCPPTSRMDTITDSELQHNITNSSLVQKYRTTIDRQSAYEILSQKIANPDTDVDMHQPQKTWPGMIEKFAKSSVGKQLGRSIVREWSKILFGMIFGKR